MEISRWEIVGIIMFVVGVLLAGAGAIIVVLKR